MRRLRGQLAVRALRAQVALRHHAVPGAVLHAGQAAIVGHDAQQGQRAALHLLRRRLQERQHGRLVGEALLEHLVARHALGVGQARAHQGMAGVELERAAQLDHGLRELAGRDQPLALRQQRLDAHAHVLLEPHARERLLRTIEQRGRLAVRGIGRRFRERFQGLLVLARLEQRLARTEGRVALLLRGLGQDVRLGVALALQRHDVPGIERQHTLERDPRFRGLFGLQQPLPLGEAVLDLLGVGRPLGPLVLLGANALDLLGHLLPHRQLQHLGHLLGLRQPGQRLVRLAVAEELGPFAPQALDLLARAADGLLLLRSLLVRVHLGLRLVTPAPQVRVETRASDGALLLLDVEHADRGVVVGQALIADALLVVREVALDEVHAVRAQVDAGARPQPHRLLEAAQRLLVAAGAHRGLRVAVVVVPLLDGPGRRGQEQQDRQQR